MNLNAVFEPFTPLAQGQYDETAEKVVFLSGWNQQTDENAYDQTLHISQTTGSTAGFYFSGERFFILFSSGPTFGQVDLYIDDVFFATLNQYSPEPGFQKYWNSPVLANSQHLIMLIHSGEGQVNLDAVIIDPQIEFLDPGIYDDTDEKISYTTEGWNLSEAQEAFNETLHSSITVGSSASFGIHRISIQYPVYITFYSGNPGYFH